MFRSLLGGLGGVGLFLAAGWGVTALVPALRTLPLARRAGYAYLLGVAALGGALYAGSHLAGLPLRRVAILPIAFGLSALALWPRGGPGWPAGRRPWKMDQGRLGRPAEPTLHRILRLGCAAIATLVVLGAFAEAVSRPLEDWDGRMTWSVRGKHLRAEGTVDPTVLTDARWSSSHPRYPVLLPLAQAVVAETFAMDEDEPAFRALYPAFLAALLLILYDGALRWAGPVAAPLAVALLASTPFLSFGLEGGAIGAYSDLPLAGFYGSGLLLLLRRPRGRGRLVADLAGGLLLAAAVLCKNEGALLALHALGLAAVRRWRAPWKVRSPLLGALLALALALALLRHWKAGIPNRDDEDYGRILALGVGQLAAQVPSRLAAALPPILRQGFSWRSWNLLPWIGPLLLALGRRGLGGKRRGLALLLAAAAAGPIVLALAAYSIHWDSAGLATVTWNRLLLQAMVPLGLLLALAIRGALGQPVRKPA